ncbi:MAG TPA: metallophosphoesterase, partial [Polyangiaceae bacterium]|nr:metallophosphoesterase [Polyangiaceae bacterium]
SEFKEIVAALAVKDVRFIPGEHDAAPDHGDAYQQAFGDSHYAFDHKGVHFVALDNVSETGGALGDSQLAWLRSDLAKTPEQTPLVVLAHRPLFDLYPEWEWATRDGDQAIEVLSKRQNVTVFYGHIHQENHHVAGSITHHSARSLIFPLPAPGSVPKKAPLPWDPQSPDHGLGYRKVELGGAAPKLTEIPYRAT